MPRQRLTDRSIKQKPPAAGQTELWDTVLLGFGIRISYGGRRTFFIMTRINGKQIRRTVGRYPAFSLAEARDRGRGLLGDSARGLDPKEREREERREAQLARRNTFAAVAADFMEDHGRKLRTAAEYQRKLDIDILPHWGDRPITEIDRADVKALIRAKARTSPIAANRVLALVRSIFNWSLDEEIIAASPAARIKPEPEIERERVLTDDELRHVWLAAERIGYPVGHLVRFLILTGQRRGEVSGLTWSEIDGDQWRLPGDRSKKGAGHLVPLSDLARDVLAGCAIFESSELVFTNGGHRPMSGWGKFKQRLDRVITEQRGRPIEDWHLHDLRRTCATGMRSLGIDRLTVSKVLNHAEGGITRVYDRYAADPEKRLALVAWAQHVEAIVSGEPAPANVVTLADARA